MLAMLPESLKTVQAIGERGELPSRQKTIGHWGQKGAAQSTQ
jgi:hypothetical protein